MFAANYRARLEELSEMTFGEVILIAYVPLVLVGVWRMRQIGIKPFDLFVFIGNTGACVWLLFLFSFLSSDEHTARGVHTPSDRWIPWGCLLVSALFYPITIRGIILSLRSRRAGGPLGEKTGTDGRSGPQN